MIRGNSSFIQMRYIIQLFANNEIYKMFLQCSSARSIWQKWTTCPNSMARGPNRHRAQCIGLRLALMICIWKASAEHRWSSQNLLLEK